MPKIIGREDKVDFPEFDKEDVRVKIDTGARTSSMHATRIKIVQKDNVEVLKCALLNNRKLHTFQDFDCKTVKSSNGAVEKRYVIRTAIVLFGKTIKSEFTLTKRTSMAFPVLLGRRLLNRRFVVDVSKRNLSYKLKTS